MRHAFVILFFSVYGVVLGQKSCPSRPVVIDIDGGVDDARVCLSLLSSHDNEVLCITTTHGILSADAAARKAKVMLSHLHHEGIPIAASRDTSFTPSVVNGICSTAYWGREDSVMVCEDVSTDSLLAGTLASCPRRAMVIACGPLTNIASLIENAPREAMRISEIIWSSSDTSQGYNYLSDTVSAIKVLRSGIPIRVVSDADRAISNRRIMRALRRIDNEYSRVFCGNTLSVCPHLPPLADLCAVLYLYYPQMFSSQGDAHISLHTLRSEVSDGEICRAVVEILSGFHHPEQQMFSSFPCQPMHFYDDVKSISDDIISHHGYKEWKAGVLTGEMHGHLGVYAMIGVKMGIRACEYLGAWKDDVQILSMTADAPPESCMNDGLQVATGATLGHGLIRLDSSHRKGPSAVFRRGEKCVELSLKPHIRSMIEADVARCLADYGLSSKQYWDEIRRLALKYWQQLSRYEIFDIRPVSYRDR